MCHICNMELYEPSDARLNHTVAGLEALPPSWKDGTFVITSSKIRSKRFPVKKPLFVFLLKGRWHLEVLPGQGSHAGDGKVKGHYHGRGLERSSTAVGATVRNHLTVTF